ncbi:hypothetical protein [Clostridium merdae]|uniref:hypothetical protein n=1 Tax=Clostridium merdae TaxID=1958780 RepID=UPI000A26BB66|nr:hypothetical protein [Clostridium merdae]
MKTLILNGSPKGNSEKSGSYFLAKAFVSQMEHPCEIRALATENQEELVQYMGGFDHIILISPNYIHALPGIVIKFLEKLTPLESSNRAFGFIIQSGYPESAESELIGKYVTKLVQRLGYECLGTVIKGECAGIAIMPNMFQKLAKRFAAFGKDYEQTGVFSNAFIEEFGEPYRLSDSSIRKLNMLDKIGVAKIGWHKMQKKHGGYEKRMDTPFAPATQVERT